ncbi:hypothetical protein STIUS_v1c00940 [Spiroplasma sp. TIUS-1]|uniref:hypothetical protein n=1 Tax=Spiroplasma sp. TIUS-1 TaxID=216963 RepID=UPI0013986CDF|nr:hypothetical protein [Spiroplasma sp. TIUS-1]QHX35649.1 hypothetical protein STIUS_v1c00940 [Spiroplasma sp. TIUS-1]
MPWYFGVLIFFAVIFFIVLIIWSIFEQAKRKERFETILYGLINESKLYLKKANYSFENNYIYESMVSEVKSIISDNRSSTLWAVKDSIIQRSPNMISKVYRTVNKYICEDRGIEVTKIRVKSEDTQLINYEKTLYIDEHENKNENNVNSNGLINNESKNNNYKTHEKKPKKSRINY